MIRHARSDFLMNCLKCEEIRHHAGNHISMLVFISASLFAVLYTRISVVSEFEIQLSDYVVQEWKSRTKYKEAKLLISTNGELLSPSLDSTLRLLRVLRDT